MTVPPPPPIDLVSLLVLVASLLFGDTLGHALGPYAVIVLGALLGAAWSASRLDPRGGVSTLRHIAMMVVLALIVTVPLASWGADYFQIERRWLFGPVAVVIAGVGPDWPAVARWAAALARNAVEAIANRRNGDGGRGGQGGEP